MNKLLMFMLGAAAGSLVTWKLIEKRYQRLADEEIQSVVDQYKNKFKSTIEITPEGLTLKDENDKEIYSLKDKKIELKDCIIEDVPWTTEEKEEYEELASDYATDKELDGYTIEVEEKPESVAPYVISPDEFDEVGNELKTLIYYADGVLADEDDDIVDSPENLIGDALKHFGDYEDDCVHVRNENEECDFEILRSEKTFSEVYKGDN